VTNCSEHIVSHTYPAPTHALHAHASLYLLISVTHRFFFFFFFFFEDSTSHSPTVRAFWPAHCHYVCSSCHIFSSTHGCLQCPKHMPSPPLPDTHMFFPSLPYSPCILGSSSPHPTLPPLCSTLLPACPLHLFPILPAVILLLAATTLSTPPASSATRAAFDCLRLYVTGHLPFRLPPDGFVRSTALDACARRLTRVSPASFALRRLHLPLPLRDYYRPTWTRLHFHCNGFRPHAPPVRTRVLFCLHLTTSLFTRTPPVLPSRCFAHATPVAPLALPAGLYRDRVVRAHLHACLRLSWFGRHNIFARILAVTLLRVVHLYVLLRLRHTAVVRALPRVGREDTPARVRSTRAVFPVPTTPPCIPRAVCVPFTRAHDAMPTPGISRVCVTILLPARGWTYCPHRRSFAYIPRRSLTRRRDGSLIAVRIPVPVTGHICAQHHHRYALPFFACVALFYICSAFSSG